jgi:hypothetical protein
LRLRFLQLQTGLYIEAIHALMVDEFARLAQFQKDHARAVAPMALDQGDDFVLERSDAVLG